ncbi:MAG: efflux transporter outer membrane subunit [Telluria sp.]
MIKPIVQGALALAVAAALSGCGTVGKDFVAPQGLGADTQAWRHAGTQNDTARLPASWWTVFGDDTLDNLEQRALRDNPGVLASAQRLVQAQAQLGVTRAGELPQASVGASVSKSRTSAETPQGIAFGHRAIEGNQYSVGGQLSWEIDLWGRVRRVVEAADAQALAAQYDRDGVMLMLSGQVATAYWQLRGLDAELAILRDALATRQEAQQLVEARFNAGLTNELDVSRARVERANAEADLQEVQRQRNLVEHGLAVLVGVSPSVPLVAAVKDAALPQPPAIPVGLPATVLSQRPDLASSVAGLRASNAQVGVAEAAFYPSVSLTGSYGFASESLHDITSADARQFSFGPLGISLPIFDGGRNRANLKLAQARYEEAVANHKGRLLTALREVEDALSDVQQRQKQGAVQEQARQAADRALLVAQARYQRGVSTYLDVTDAQRSALQADRAGVQIATQRLLASVAVARSLGGGWTAQSSSPVVAQATTK